MKVTVLPVRDPALPERRSYSGSSGPSVGSDSGFEGMFSVSVELLRVPRRRQAPARAPASPAPVPASPPAPAAVEIELPNGRVVRVPPGFSSADLERVLAIASAGEPDPAPAPPPPAPPGERPR